VRALIVLAMVGVATPAHADVDWQRGLITIKAVGTADRRAPSPAVARPGALREGETRAEAALLELARGLPRAQGGTIGEAADADPLVAAALAAVVAAPIEVATDFLPDGSVRVERALPIEAIRQAIAGPERFVPAGADAITAIVVDARKLKLKPAVGIAVTDGQATLELPALFDGKPPADDDPRLGARPLRVTAKRLDHGALAGDGIDLAALAAPGILLIVVIREKK
jgi:hypothetical protein